MTRALVLNAGASWCAYQYGALRHLVGERGLQFDICAGTGFGAMHAAFVACGQLEALEPFWSSPRPVDLLPWRRRRFVAAHVSERALVDRSTELVVTTLDIDRGELWALHYPGSDVPLVDALMAASAFPGLTRPSRFRGRRFAAGSFVDSAPMAPALALGPDEVVAVLALLPPGGGPRRSYATWPPATARALEVNHDHDGHLAIASARSAAAEVAAYRSLRAAAPDALAGAGVEDDVVEAVRRLVDARTPRGPGRVVVVRPSRALGYPMWRFRPSDLAAAAALGAVDARAAA